MLQMTTMLASISTLRSAAAVPASYYYYRREVGTS
jgi:hypothetical protein